MFEDPNLPSGGSSDPSDPPVGTSGSGIKSVPSDVEAFQDPTTSDPPVGTGDSGTTNTADSDPPVGTTGTGV